MCQLLEEPLSSWRLAHSANLGTTSCGRAAPVFFRLGAYPRNREIGADASTPGKVFVNLFQKVVGWRGKAPLPAAAGGILTKKRSGREMKQSGGLFHRGKPYPGVSRCPGGTGWRLMLRINSLKKALYVIRETYILRHAPQNRPFSGWVEIGASR